MSTRVFTATHTHPQIRDEGEYEWILNNPKQIQRSHGLPKIGKRWTVRLKVTACMLKLRQQRGTEYITAKTHKRPCARGTIRYANEALTYGES